MEECGDKPGPSSRPREKRESANPSHAVNEVKQERLGAGTYSDYRSLHTAEGGNSSCRPDIATCAFARAFPEKLSHEEFLSGICS